MLVGTLSLFGQISGAVVRVTGRPYSAKCAISTANLPKLPIGVWFMAYNRRRNRIKSGHVHSVRLCFLTCGDRLCALLS